MGQRDLDEKSWLELRGLVVFDLAPLRQAAVVKATLQLEHVNAVEAPPWDAVVVDHLDSPAGTIASEDYHRDASQSRLGILMPPERAGKRGPCRIDVTDAILRDLTAGHRYAAFRLRPANGVTADDRKVHFLVFRGHGSETPPVLDVTVADQ